MRSPKDGKRLLAWLLVAHILVLGYWLGSELVINATYRYVCYADKMPFKERARLMDHVMHVDQHVRYALVMQTSLGTMLAAGYGFVPGGSLTMAGAAIIGVIWLGFVEAVHRLRIKSIGTGLAKVDRVMRYLLIVILVAVAVGLAGKTWAMPDWLRWKLFAFAGVVACGVGIRIALLKHFRVWAEMRSHGVSAQRNAIVKHTYVRATAVLVILWGCIAAMTYLSVAKPMQ